jgi:hypothetical protein
MLISVCVNVFCLRGEKLEGTAEIIFGIGVWLLAVIVAYDDLRRHVKKSKNNGELRQPR